MTTVKELIEALEQLEPHLPVGVFLAAQNSGAVKYEVLGLDMVTPTLYTDNGQAAAWVVANHIDHDTNPTDHLWNARPRSWPIQRDCGCYVETTVNPGEVLNLDAGHDCGNDRQPPPFVLTESTFLHPQHPRVFETNPVDFGTYRTT